MRIILGDLMTDIEHGIDDRPARHELWLAKVQMPMMMDPDESPIRSYVLAAGDALEAEHTLFRYPGLLGARLIALYETADNVALVWDQDGEPLELTPKAPDGTDLD